MIKTFVIYADFIKLTTLANHTCNITFNTSEMGEKTSLLLPHLNQQGSLAFKVGEFNDTELEELPEAKEFPEQKSQSKRLRDVLFVLHQQSGGKKEEFEDYYRRQMEIFINQIKNKLE